MLHLPTAQWKLLPTFKSIQEVISSVFLPNKFSPVIHDTESKIGKIKGMLQAIINMNLSSYQSP